MKSILTFFASVGGSILLADAARAQSGGGYSIINSTVDSGGGQSSGGSYVLTGTVGQGDASQVSSTGNGYALAGGFWPVVLIQIASGHQLTIAKEGTGVRLNWPAAARDEGYYLQTTTDIKSGWSDVAGTTGVTTYLQPTITGTLRYYRLRKP